MLVAGAGPTGLTLACELLRRGLGVRIVDESEARTTLSRAIAVHARTLEIFEDMGIADETVAAGLPLGGLQMIAGGKPVVQASFDALDTRYPFLLGIPQAETEALLERLLGRLGGRVERRTELVGLLAARPQRSASRNAVTSSRIPTTVGSLNFACQPCFWPVISW